MAELAAAAPDEAWTGILTAHLAAMQHQAAAIQELRDSNEQFLRVAVRSTQETAANLQPAAGTYDAQGRAIDPVTGLPLQADPNAGLNNAPIDPQTGMPMVLVTDPATGQQVWVPSAPASSQQQFQGQQVQPTSPFAPPGAVGQQPQQPVYQNENSQRTLMDLLFGN